MPALSVTIAPDGLTTVKAESSSIWVDFIGVNATRLARLEHALREKEVLAGVISIQSPAYKIHWT